MDSPLSSFKLLSNHTERSTIPHYTLRHAINNLLGPAALPFFIIIRAFKISSSLIGSQGFDLIQRLIGVWAGVEHSVIDDVFFVTNSG